MYSKQEYRIKFFVCVSRRQTDFSLKIKPDYSYQSESKFVNGILVSYHDLK